MKELLLLTILLAASALAGCSTLVKNDNRPIKLDSGSENRAAEMTRKSELELEGFINDYFYRRQIKDPSLFSDFDAYGSVLAKSIVVYVYPKNDLLQGRVEDMKEMIKKDLQEQLLDFPGFEWVKNYNFDVVVR
ncbi:MAG: hypothetical protein NTZ80_03660 [Patescibacteria group bacterium]|nr:hypothetical protein [Patescibacteria group bacterium]